MSAGSPASSPGKSRLVEAICIHLCERFPQARKSTVDGRTEYTSRWRLVLSAYNAVRARLLNSHRLLEDTNLTLFTINERTLVSWFKDTVRRDEIKVLMQGISLPAPRLCASVALPPAQQQPSTPPDPPPQQHQQEEPEDRTGLAQVRYKAPAVNVASLSRTTLWRQRKKAAIASTSASAASTSKATTVVVSVAPTSVAATSVVPTSAASTSASFSRKEYSCRICGKAMSSPDHSQFRGKRYCPSLYPEVSKEEWLALRRAEAKAKAGSKEPKAPEPQ